MRVFKLDVRLAAIAEAVPRGAVLCDVGSDHGRLPVRLLLDGSIERAIVSDIAEKPLEMARKLAERYRVSDKAQFVCCDGVPPEAARNADTIVVAGMGGGTIAGILECAALSDGKRLILQPMSSPEDLRTLLYQGKFTIEQERLVTDGRRQYVVIEAKTGGIAEPYSLADAIAGQYIADAQYLKKCIFRLRNEMYSFKDTRKPDLIAAITILESKMNNE